MEAFKEAIEKAAVEATKTVIEKAVEATESIIQD